MTHPRLLFVTGLGRSGTTALVEIMASHPAIALGVERFKALWNPPAAIRGLTSDLFERERFFDFSTGLTNLTPEAFDRRWEEHYHRMALKWDTATYVGDKMTAPRMQQLWKSYPDAWFLCIVRDLDAVAHSWNKRAMDPEDRGWPARKDAQVAVKRWNGELSKIRKARLQRPDRVVIVEHASFFADPTAQSLRTVLEFLELDWTPSIADAFDVAHGVFLSQVAHKDRDLPEHVAAHLHLHADRELWREVTSLTV